MMKFSDKTIRLLVASLFMVIASTGANLYASDIFESLAGRPHVECSYISGRFANSKKIWVSADGAHSFDLSRGFSALYSYQCYSKEDVADARELLDKYLKRNKDMELVMKTIQGSQEYYVYEKFNNDNLLMQMIIWSSTSSTCEVVVIDWDKGLPRKSDSTS